MKQEEILSYWLKTTQIPIIRTLVTLNRMIAARIRVIWKRCA